MVYYKKYGYGKSKRYSKKRKYGKTWSQAQKKRVALKTEANYKDTDLATPDAVLAANTWKIVDITNISTNTGFGNRQRESILATFLNIKGVTSITASSSKNVHQRMMVVATKKQTALVAGELPTDSFKQTNKNSYKVLFDKNYVKVGEPNTASSNYAYPDTKLDIIMKLNDIVEYTDGAGSSISSGHIYACFLSNKAGTFNGQSRLYFKG
jgi:hypothetical protein